jgi:SLT domain-containing protein
LVFLEKKFGFISGAFKLFSDGFTRYIINPVKTALSFIGDLINAIQSIPGVGAIGGAIGAVGGFLGKIPGLAEGGIVTRPTLAMIGEGGQSEAVIPLDKLGNMGGATNITINVQGADPQQVVNALERYVRQNGALPGALL